MFLSVIIPSYNEEENIKRGVLEQVKNYLEKKDFSWEVLISDDGSTDKSSILVKETISSWINFQLLENNHGGKPFALFQALKKARGKYVLFSDMDQSTPVSELDKLLPYVDKNYSAIIGSRGMNRKNFPLYRKIGAVVFMTVRKTFLLSDINDTQCGFKLFERTVLEKVFGKLEFFRNKRNAVGWTVTSYDVELLHLIKKAGGKIKEVKVKWEDVDESTGKGGKVSRYLKESKDMFKQIVRVKLNDLKGYYNV